MESRLEESKFRGNECSFHFICLSPNSIKAMSTVLIELFSFILEFEKACLQGSSSLFSLAVGQTVQIILLVFTVKIFSQTKMPWNGIVCHS